MAMTYSPVAELAVAVNYLKMIETEKNDSPNQFLPSEQVYCVNPLTHFKTRYPLSLHNGKYFFVKRTEESGKTDGCGSGCWRIMARDKLIKSEDKEKTKIEILGFKKVYKFCEKEKPRSNCKVVEIEKRRVMDKRVWVMEEYRLASKWKQDYVICKIRRLDPDSLELMLSDHIRGYD